MTPSTMPKFRTFAASEEYAIIRRMTFEAEDEFEAMEMATDEFRLHVGKDDEGLKVTATEI